MSDDVLRELIGGTVIGYQREWTGSDLRRVRLSVKLASGREVKLVVTGVPCGDEACIGAVSAEVTA